MPKGAHNKRNSTHPRRLEIRAKEEQAVELRMAGVKLKDIAETVWGPGTDPSTARKAIVRLMQEQGAEPAEELRQLEIRRLDRALQAIWQDVLSGNFLAIDRMLKLQERKAMLLGLDAPVKRIVEVVTPEVLQEALAAAEEENQRLKRQLDEAGGELEIDMSEITAEARKEIEAGRAEVVAHATIIEDAEVVDASQGQAPPAG